MQAKLVFNYHRDRQHECRPKPIFLIRQPRLSTNMRGILVDWLIEVADEYQLLPDTLFAAVNYVDRCLEKVNVSRRSLQLLGCACMLLATKHEETCTHLVEDFVDISDNTYTKDEIVVSGHLLLHP